MAGFLEQLEADGRAVRIELPRCREPLRWVLAEQVATYAAAFGLSFSRDAERSADVDADGTLALRSASRLNDERRSAGETILRRFLKRTRWSVCRCARSLPFERGWAERQLDEWAQTGRAIRVCQLSSAAREPSWSLPDNLDQVQRGSLALLRREVLTCSPQHFADFLLRWQYVHPEKDTDWRKWPDGDVGTTPKFHRPS